MSNSKLFGYRFPLLKNISVLRNSYANKIVESQQEMLEEEVWEGEEQQFNDENAREGNVDEVDEVVLENKYKENIRYEDSGQSNGVRDIGREGWVGVT